MLTNVKINYKATEYQVSVAVADLRGARGTRPPRGSKFFQFHSVFGKIWQNRMLAPPGELAPPPRGNPGSATDSGGSRIFPRGVPTPKIAIIIHIFAENCIKMKEFGPPGGARVPGAPLGSAND